MRRTIALALLAVAGLGASPLGSLNPLKLRRIVRRHHDIGPLAAQPSLEVAAPELKHEPVVAKPVEKAPSQVTITSEPEGAEVLINGAFAGVTPLTVNQWRVGQS